jgi:hypothetical protein
MMQTEQMLNKKLDNLYQDQRREKDNYESQLQRMQAEIGKMCDLMHELNKKKKRATSKNGTQKTNRIAMLEQ